jgi:hypothetical protein
MMLHKQTVGFGVVNLVVTTLPDVTNSFYGTTVSITMKKLDNHNININPYPTYFYSDKRLYVGGFYDPTSDKNKGFLAHLDLSQSCISTTTDTTYLTSSMTKLSSTSNSGTATTSATAYTLSTLTGDSIIDLSTTFTRYSSLCGYPDTNALAFTLINPAVPANTVGYTYPLITCYLYTLCTIDVG